MSSPFSICHVLGACVATIIPTKRLSAPVYGLPFNLLCFLLFSAVRSKAAAGHSERSREASSQRVQRQPSATRGPKTKSSGSSSSSSQINSTWAPGQHDTVCKYVVFFTSNLSLCKTEWCVFKGLFLPNYKKHHYMRVEFVFVSADNSIKM